MVISKLNKDKIEKLLSLIQEFISNMKPLAKMPEEAFFSDNRNIASAESYLRRSLEAIFDIGRHIIAKSYGIKELEYKKIAVELGEKGVISKEYAKTLRQMAGFRNRMVHLYQELPDKEIYIILQNNLKDLERFISEITAFLEEYEKGLKNK